MRSWPIVAVLGCASSAPRAIDRGEASSSSDAAVSRAATSRAGCVDVAADIARRAPGATPAPPDQQIDLDGDGALDPMFRGYCSMMGGNCDYYLFASGDGCARYVGTVQVTRVSSGPHCADPPSGRTPCRISASRMMIHGEIYEYFYRYGPDGYFEAGVGHQGPRPPAKHRP